MKRIKATLIENEDEYCLDIYESEDGDYIQNIDYECFKKKKDAIKRLKDINNGKGYMDD